MRALSWSVANKKRDAKDTKEPSDVGRVLDPRKIADADLRSLIVGVLNDNESLRRTVARLREEIDRLRGKGPGGSGGSSGKTSGAASDGADTGNKPKDNSSTKDRENARAALDSEQGKSSDEKADEKKNRGKPTGPRFIVIDKDVELSDRPAGTPDDAVLKGFGAGRIVQDLLIQKHAVRFLVGRWHSPSTGQTYYAELPAGTRDSFGPTLQAYMLTMNIVLGAPHKRLHEHLVDLGIVISEGQVSNLLVHGHEDFHNEKARVHVEGVSASAYIQTDDTGTKVAGTSGHCFTVGNEAFTSLVTQPSKDRVHAIGAIGGGAPEFVVNARATELAVRFGVPPTHRAHMSNLPIDVRMDTATVESELAKHYDWSGPGSLRLLKDAMALAATELRVSVPKGLMADGAATFDKIADYRALCWIHGGRHLSELSPTVEWFQCELGDVKTTWWTLFERVQRYRIAPTKREKKSIIAALDRLLATPCDYRSLREVLSRLKERRTELLVPLRHPVMPADNNLSERDLRGRAKKRDVSYGPRTQAGLLAWDTFQSLYATVRKLGISWWQFLRDRIEHRGKIEPLETLVVAKLRALGLDSGAWERERLVKIPALAA